MDDPGVPEKTGLRFMQELPMTPEYLIEELSGWEKVLFRKLYAGSMAKKLYRLYEYFGEKP